MDCLLRLGGSSAVSCSVDGKYRLNIVSRKIVSASPNCKP